MVMRLTEAQLMAHVEYMRKEVHQLRRFVAYLEKVRISPTTIAIKLLAVRIEKQLLALENEV